MAVFNINHVVFEDMPQESHARLAIIVVDVAIYAVAVDAGLHEQGRDDKYFGMVGIIGKGTRVGHYATIEAGGCCLVSEAVGIKLI